MIQLKSFRAQNCAPADWNLRRGSITRSIGDGHRDARQWLQSGCRILPNPRGKSRRLRDLDSGRQLLQGGRQLARSLAAYRKAQQLHPDSFEVHLQLGHLHKVCGHYSTALASYERAAALDPEFGEIKHEIVDLSERIKSSIGKSTTLELFASVEELIDALRKLQDEDPFAAPFARSGDTPIERPLSARAGPGRVSSRYRLPSRRARRGHRSVPGEPRMPPRGPRRSGASSSIAPRSISPSSPPGYPASSESTLKSAMPGPPAAASRLYRCLSADGLTLVRPVPGRGTPRRTSSPAPAQARRPAKRAAADTRGSHGTICAMCSTTD